MNINYFFLQNPLKVPHEAIYCRFDIKPLKRIFIGIKLNFKEFLDEAH